MVSTTKKNHVGEEMNLKHLRFTIDEFGVATALIDLEGEKVNTLSQKLSDDLGKLLERVETDTTIKALVLGSAKQDSFVVGADISMLKGFTSAAEATRAVRELQQAFARLEALHQEWGKPVVAALNGTTLGGGLELALACSQRVCNDSTRTTLGFPEVKLGLFPGAGGTQRAPRLVGIANALDLILTGRNLRPKQALKMGLVDEIVPGPILLDVARRRAREAAQGLHKEPQGLAKVKAMAHKLQDPAFLQQLALEENPVGQRILFKKAREGLLAKTRGNYPGPEKALEVLRIGIQEGLEAGYAAEADRFGQLVVSPQARALMSIFFATQELKKDTGIGDAKAEPRPVTKLAMLGGGLMGGGIAAVTAMQAKIPVRIKDVDAKAAARGVGYAQKLLDKDVKKRRRSWQEALQIMSRITGTGDYSGFKGCEVVIEAVFEDLKLKHRVLQEVEANGRDDVIFASNTSSIPITQIAEGGKRPENVIGMHYFSPVEKMPLLEIIVTKKTAPWVTATCVELGKKQGKTVIVVNDGTGFYTSRILAPYMIEAFWILSEGAAIQDIDEAMMDWGFPVGPVVLTDEVGIDVGAKVTKIMEHAFGKRMQVPGNIDSLIKDNRLGRKNGRGFYLYEKGKKGGPDETVYALFGQDKTRKSVAKGEIQRRIGLQMVNEALRCLQDGVLRSPRDGDIGAIFGLGFPPFRGGPFSYVDHVGAAEVQRRLEQLAERHGPRFAPAEILGEYAKGGKKFRS